MTPLPPNDPRTRWYYADANNEPQGPLSPEALSRLVDAGRIDARTPIIEEGGTTWATYGAIFPTRSRSQTPFPHAPVAKKEMTFRDCVIVACLGFATFAFLTSGVVSVFGKRLLPASPSPLTPARLSEIRTEPIDVEFEVSTEEVPEGLIVKGTTNLPDYTKLTVSCLGEIAGERIQAGDDYCVVKNGKFSTGPLKYQETRCLPAGSYEITVEMLTREQTEYVESAIGGKGGPNLRGDKIQKYDSGEKSLTETLTVEVKSPESRALGEGLEKQYKDNRSALFTLYRELMRLKGTDDFLRYGFAHSTWLKEVEAVMDRDNSTSGECRVAGVNMKLLGLEYHTTHGQESRQTAYYKDEITRTIGVAK